MRGECIASFIALYLPWPVVFKLVFPRVIRSKTKDKKPTSGLEPLTCSLRVSYSIPKERPAPPISSSHKLDLAPFIGKRGPPAKIGAQRSVQLPDEVIDDIGNLPCGLVEQHREVVGFS